mmetsp:Transcript_75611/g.130923  ORF Transcript_75611/g.130923 Transcript_75611/m.130923 type:complete len:205 (-) Transcript_75611:133-747(-)
MTKGSPFSFVDDVLQKPRKAFSMLMPEKFPGQSAHGARERSSCGSRAAQPAAQTKFFRCWARLPSAVSSLLRKDGSSLGAVSLNARKGSAALLDREHICSSLSTDCNTLNPSCGTSGGDASIEAVRAVMDPLWLSVTRRSTLRFWPKVCRSDPSSSSPGPACESPTSLREQDVGFVLPGHECALTVLKTIKKLAVVHHVILLFH